MTEEFSTKHVLQGRELIDYLVEKTSSTANAELVRREERRNRRTTFILSVLTAVGIGGAVGAIKMMINDQMRNVRTEMELMAGNLEEEIHAQAKLLEEKFEGKISSAVDEQVDEKVGQVRTLLDQYKDYQEFLALSELIEAEVENDKLPDKPLQSALKLVDQLATAEGIIENPRFMEAVKVIIDILVRTDRKTEIDNLEGALREVLATDSKISLDLADHYGQLIIASPYPVEEMQKEFEVLSRYARSSRELKYPEKALMWELFVAYKRSQYQRTPTTDRMVETVQDLNEADTRNFCYHIFLNSHPLHWMNTPDQEGRELARLVTSLLDDYPNLRQTVETQIATPELRPSVENLISRKLERLERLQPAAETQDNPQTAVTTASEEDNTLRR
ncbi:MAG: hypothetical protein KDA57_12925 [Planctomycetales bacterium]|nr:hypothetical protein [Planctomycetales bacterium]